MTVDDIVEIAKNYDSFLGFFKNRPSLYLMWVYLDYKENNNIIIRHIETQCESDIFNEILANKIVNIENDILLNTFEVYKHILQYEYDISYMKKLNISFNIINSEIRKRKIKNII